MIHIWGIELSPGLPDRDAELLCRFGNVGSPSLLAAGILVILDTPRWGR